ncbi:hypothetical protein VZT92_010560 [Zoarces viviparus]|uniref:Uncharacterized protein n=1 Tax=Zoarces viviparus TaxID=48416 RepID=A0AAW1F9E1_ZOAVI
MGAVNRWPGKYFVTEAFKSEQEQLVSTVGLLGRLAPICASLERCTHSEVGPGHGIDPDYQCYHWDDIFRLVRQKATALCLISGLMGVYLHKDFHGYSSALRGMLTIPRTEPRVYDINTAVNGKQG